MGNLEQTKINIELTRHCTDNNPNSGLSQDLGVVKQHPDPKLFTWFRSNAQKKPHPITVHFQCNPFTYQLAVCSLMLFYEKKNCFFKSLFIVNTGTLQCSPVPVKNNQYIYSLSNNHHHQHYLQSKCNSLLYAHLTL